MRKNKMDRNQSAVINFLRFPLVILVVMLHAYTVTQNNVELNTGHLIYKFLTYNFSLLFGSIAVPIFFFISGYLFFNPYSAIGKNYYIAKWKKRFHTLFFAIYYLEFIDYIFVLWFTRKCANRRLFFRRV